MKASRITLTLTLILALMTVAGSAMAQIKLTDTETQKLYITAVACVAIDDGPAMQRAWTSSSRARQ